MRYEFKWSMLLDQPYHEWIVDAVLTTLHLALVSWIIALAVGIFIGIARISSSRLLRFLGGTYVELFRNVPLLLQLFLWLYVFPEIMPGEWRQWWYRLDQVPYLTAVIGLSLFTASRVA
ncbi:MAG: ABC transporter permease subunit, partial [Gemmatimonadaceae bacterium]